MIKFYLTQIKLHRITIDDVPTKFREKVKKELEEEKNENN